MGTRRAGRTIVMERILRRIEPAITSSEIRGYNYAAAGRRTSTFFQYRSRQQIRYGFFHYRCRMYDIQSTSYDIVGYRVDICTSINVKSILLAG
jgi:hypothetical protein